MEEGLEWNYVVELGLNSAKPKALVAAECPLYGRMI